MATRPTTPKATANSRKRRAVAKLTPEERDEYAMRRDAYLLTRTMLVATAAHLDVMGAELREKYELPTEYFIDMDTGTVREGSK